MNNIYSKLKEMLSNHLYIVSILKSTCWFLSLTRGINTSNLFSELVNHLIHAVASPLWTVSKPKIFIYKKTIFVHVDSDTALSSLQLLN